MLQRTLTFFILLFSLSLTLVEAGKFDTAACASDSECTSQCCGFKSGVCAGPIVAQQRDGGCGHGDPQPNDRAAVAFRASMGLQQSAAASGTTMAVMVSTTKAAAAATAAVAATGATGATGAAGSFFITHPCASDSECQSSCCGFKSGLCAGPVIAQERDGGCGHGNAQPNADAARAFGFTGQPGQG